MRIWRICLHRGRRRRTDDAGRDGASGAGAGCTVVTSLAAYIPHLPLTVAINTRGDTSSCVIVGRCQGKVHRSHEHVLTLITMKHPKSKGCVIRGVQDDQASLRRRGPPRSSRGLSHGKRGLWGPRGA